MDQNRQFEDAIHGLTYAKESLDPARCVELQNLTVLVSYLTTGCGTMISLHRWMF